MEVRGQVWKETLVGGTSFTETTKVQSRPIQKKGKSVYAKRGHGEGSQVGEN